MIAASAGTPLGAPPQILRVARSRGTLSRCRRAEAAREWSHDALCAFLASTPQVPTGSDDRRGRPVDAAGMEVEGTDTPLSVVSGAHLHRRVAAALWACAPLVVGDVLGRARETAAATGCSVEEALPYEVSLLDVHSHHVAPTAATSAVAHGDAERRPVLVSEGDLWAVGDAQHVRIVWRDAVAATAFRDATGGEDGGGRHKGGDSRGARRVLTLDQCLRAFVRPESLSAHDESTGLADQPCTKTLELWRAPPLLVVQLKRFAFMGLGEKLETRVEFPLQDLDLSPCMRHGRREAGEDRYDLFAVVNHYGSLGAGHYTSFVREGVGADARWWECDDRCVCLPAYYFPPALTHSLTRCALPGPRSAVQEVAGEEVVTDAAYMLCYVRQDLVVSWMARAEAGGGAQSEDDGRTQAAAAAAAQTSEGKLPPPPRSVKRTRGRRSRSSPPSAALSSPSRPASGGIAMSPLQGPFGTPSLPGTQGEAEEDGAKHSVRVCLSPSLTGARAPARARPMTPAGRAIGPGLVLEAVDRALRLGPPSLGAGQLPAGAAALRAVDACVAWRRCARGRQWRRERAEGQVVSSPVPRSDGSDEGRRRRAALEARRAARTIQTAWRSGRRSSARSAVANGLSNGLRRAVAGAGERRSRAASALGLHRMPVQATLVGVLALLLHFAFGLSLWTVAGLIALWLMHVTGLADAGALVGAGAADLDADDDTIAWDAIGLD